MLKLDQPTRDRIENFRNTMLERIPDDLLEKHTENARDYILYITSYMDASILGNLPEGQNICGAVQKIVQIAADFHKECCYPLPAEDFREVIRKNAAAMTLPQARKYIAMLQMSYELVSSENMVNQIYTYSEKNSMKVLAERIGITAKAAVDKLNSREAIDAAIDNLDLSRHGSGLVQKYSDDMIRDAWDDTPGRALTEIEKECMADTLQAALEACAFYEEVVNGRVAQLDKTTTPEAAALVYVADYELSKLDEDEMDYDAYAARSRSIAEAYAARVSLIAAYAPSVLVAGILFALCIAVEATPLIWALCAAYTAIIHIGVFPEWREDWLNSQHELYLDKLETMRKKREKKREKEIEKSQQRLHN